MKKFIKYLTFFLTIATIFIFIIGAIIFNKTANNYKITQANNTQIKINSIANIKTIPNLIQAQNLKTENKNKIIQSEIMLFNKIPIKNVNLQITENTKVIPCGTPFGIKIFTDGVLIVGKSDINSDNGLINPANVAGLEIGDVITSLNGINVTTNEEVLKIINESNGNEISVEYKRYNESYNTIIQPVKPCDDENYKLGIWVRDSSAGIGTLTFYDKNRGIFAGLGHGICDVDTENIMPLLKGDIVNAVINGVIKGSKGYPGELRGYFSNKTSIGNLQINNESGVYGSMENPPIENEEIPIAMKQEVKRGPAQILTTVDENISKAYDIEIESINYNVSSPTKNLIIKITDQELIEKTGGIIQGMSGSPIIQDGMLVGAVTHVFVNDPEKGYAIFAENMLESSNLIENTEYEKSVA